VLDGDHLNPTENGAAAPDFSVHVYCGQTAGWITMPLGTQVSHGPGHIVFDGGPAPLTERGTAAPTFRPMSTVAKRSPISASTAELLLSHLQKDAALWRIGTIMVGGVIAHPFAKMLWIGLMPDVDPHSLENMHCLMPTPTARRV